MKNPSDPRPLAQVVNTSKKFIVTLGVLTLFGGGIALIMGEPSLGIIGIAAGISLFLTGGIVAGISAITQAAEVYIEKETEQWEQEQARAKAEKEQVNEAEIQ